MAAAAGDAGSVQGEGASSAGFPRGARMQSPADFDRVFSARRSAARGTLVVYACEAASASQPARLGLSVSRRIGNAVVRNRWKRRLREVFRHLRPRLPAGHDFVVVVRSGAAPRGLAGIRAVEALLADLAPRAVARPGPAANGRTAGDGRGGARRTPGRRR